MVSKRLVVGLLATAFLFAVVARLAPTGVTADTTAGTTGSTTASVPQSVSMYLPLVTNHNYNTGNFLCRLGVIAGVSSLSAYAGDMPPSYQQRMTARSQPSQTRSSLAAYADLLGNLRMGMYANFRTAQSPEHPYGMRFVQTVDVKQYKSGHVLYGYEIPYEQPYSYRISPTPAEIQTIASNNPGSIWLVGNEIERRDWLSSDGVSVGGQDEILPEVYAWAYHEIYQAIKAADPTALVANGSVIVPSPLRLQYLDRVWAEYQTKYGTTMPVDVWNIHLYFAPEKRYYWGIEIPAGIDNVDVGMFYFGKDDPRNVRVNKDFTYGPGLITAFRQWMKNKGQQNKPLIITEFGVSMPDWVDPGQFTPEAVRDSYMYPALNYVLNQTDASLGYPPDGYRLVQSSFWWSLDYDAGTYTGGEFLQAFNSNLLWSGIGAPTNAPHLKGLTTVGNYWVSYVSKLPMAANPPGLGCNW